MARKSTKRSKKHEPITPTEPMVAEEAISKDIARSTAPEPSGDQSRPLPPAQGGLTGLADYYAAEPEPHKLPEPEITLTPVQRAAIRDDAFERQFGIPVPDFRTAVMARLNSKLRS